MIFQNKIQKRPLELKLVAAASRVSVTSNLNLRRIDMNRFILAAAATLIATTAQAGHL